MAEHGYQLMMAEEAKPWERQDGESAKAFEAFRTYRDLGPSRSIAKACSVLRGPGFSRDMFKTWSARWKWVNRAAQWDSYLDEQRRKETENEITKMNKRHAEAAKMFQSKAIERLRNINLEEIDASQAIRFLAEGVKIERLAMGISDKVEHEITGAGGGPIAVVDQTPERVAEILAILNSAGVIPDIVDVEVVERKQIED